MKRFLFAVVSITLLTLWLVPSLGADQWDKRTILTVNETIQVPNTVLTPGKYVVKLLDSPSNRHIVQIFNGDETALVTTILAIPNYRLEPTGNTVFTFWEMPPGQPKALRAWFYPGDSFGQEFAYPKTKAVTIAAVSHAAIPTIEAEKPAELETAPIAELAPEPVAEAPQAPAPLVVPAEVAKVAPPVAVPELPKTASPLPLIGLVGALSLIAFAVVRTVRTS